MSARNFLTRMCEIAGINSPRIRETIEKWGEDFFLSDMLDIPFVAEYYIDIQIVCN